MRLECKWRLHLLYREDGRTLLLAPFFFMRLFLPLSLFVSAAGSRRLLLHWFTRCPTDSLKRHQLHLMNHDQWVYLFNVVSINRSSEQSEVVSVEASIYCRVKTSHLR